MTDEFAISWLDARESADVRARDVGIVELIGQFRNGLESINVVDLGAGTGALFRYLAPKLGGQQTWRFIDNSDVLRQQIPSRLTAWVAETKLSIKIGKNLWCVGNDSEKYCVFYEQKDFGKGFDEFRVKPQPHLITASALLDLVSGSWIEELTAFCLRMGASFYGCLTYDGKIEWSPSHPGDTKLLQLLNQDQKRDKGLGPALGPDSLPFVTQSLASRGFSIELASTPWVLGPDDVELQYALLSQWTKLFENAAVWRPQEFYNWKKFRLETMVDSGSCLEIGHYDIWSVHPDHL